MIQSGFFDVEEELARLSGSVTNLKRFLGLWILRYSFRN